MTKKIKDGHAIILHNGMVIRLVQDGSFFYFVDVGSWHLIPVSICDNNNPNSIYRRSGPLYQEICRAVQNERTKQRGQDEQ